MHSYTEEEIALYVNGDMTGEEQQQFEQVLQRDRSLQEDVQEFRHVLTSLRTKIAPDAQDQAITRTFQSLNEEYFDLSEGKVRPVRAYVGWASAAAVIAIILVVTLFHPWKQNDLYREYANIEMVTVAERGNNDAGQLQQAADAFNKREFSASRTLLESIYKTQQENAMIAFYYAISLIETGSPDKAIVILSELSDGDSIFKYDARYFIALTYLKTENREACKSWLQKIPADNNRYAQAQSLLSKL